MFNILGVFFDRSIQNWRTQVEKIPYNVLILVVQGLVQYTINGEKITAQKGDVLFIPASAVRSGENHQSGAHQKYTAIFTLADDAALPMPFPKGQNYYHIKTRSYEYIKQRFERLYFNMRGDERYRSYICNGMLQEIIGVYAQELESSSIAPIKMRYAETIEHFLLENYREPIKIEDLAKLIHRSPSYTIAVFKEAMGQSPIQYIHQLRVTEACNLLLTTDMTVVAVSEYLGYYDAPYFSRMFKKITSISPKEFVKTRQ